MKTWVRKSFAVGALATAMLALTGTGAQAHDGVITTAVAHGNGILSGNAINIPITAVVPVQVCGNTVLGLSLMGGSCTQGNVGIVNH